MRYFVACAIIVNNLRSDVYRMMNIVKEYGILKSVLINHLDFCDFMKSLDEVLNEDDIDDVLKQLEEREKNSKGANSAHKPKTAQSGQNAVYYS